MADSHKKFLSEKKIFVGRKTNSNQTCLEIQPEYYYNLVGESAFAGHGDLRIYLIIKKDLYEEVFMFGIIMTYLKKKVTIFIYNLWRCFYKISILL